MPVLEWIWAHRNSCLKGAGLALLVTYFWQNPLYVEPIWIAAHLAIVVGVSTALVLVAYPILDRFLPGTKADAEVTGMRIVGEAKRTPLRLALLLPGEDGFFFVPLLWVGITPVTAGIAAAAFAATHYPQFPLRACVVKFVSIFCIAMVVLPHGLGSVVVGHFIADAVAVIVGSRLFVTTPAAVPPDA
jgi:hypothetical protein